MPYYTYESLLDDKDRFEFEQRMNDDPFTHHPQSGEPIRKIIVPGVAIRVSGLKRSAKVNKLSPAATACGCASNAALAEAMFANSRTTPRYGERPKKSGPRGSSHGSQSHGGHSCSGHKH